MKKLLLLLLIILPPFLSGIYPEEKKDKWYEEWNDRRYRDRTGKIRFRDEQSKEESATDSRDADIRDRRITGILNRPEKKDEAQSAPETALPAENSGKTASAVQAERSVENWLTLRKLRIINHRKNDLIRESRSNRRENRRLHRR